MSHSRFDFDDIIIGDTFAIVCCGTRRWRIEGLSQEQLMALNDASKNVDATQSAILARLGEKISTDAPQTSRRPLLSSRQATLISRPWCALASGEALTLVSVFSIALVALGATHLWWGSATLTSPTPPVAAITLLLFVAASFAAHELGHATACLRHTGVTGGMAVAMTWRGVKLAIDVSSQDLASRRAKVAIALAGPIFQIAFGSVVTFMGLMISSALPIYAGLLITLLAFRYLIPSGSTDGFWALRHAGGALALDMASCPWCMRLLASARSVVLVMGFVCGLIAVLKPLPGA